MKKLFVIVALLALLVACAPQKPVQPEVVKVEESQGSFKVNPPAEVKTEVAPEKPAEAPKVEPKAAPQTVNVEIKGFAYNPPSVKIKVGDTVTWTQVDNVKRTVTIVTGPENFDSGLLTAGQTYSHTFTKPGTYSYKC